MAPERYTPSMHTPLPITPEDVLAAERQLAGWVRRTPLLRWDPDPPPGTAHLSLKLEHLQVTGSFKARGALNALAVLPRDQLDRGVVTASGGNHGLAVAYAAARRSAPATIFLPLRAAGSIDAKVRSYGAAVVRAGHDWDDAWEAAARFASERGAALIHPFEDPPVMAGQGTVGIEMLEQQPDLDVLVIAVGGGGLIGGIACYAKSVRPDIRIIGVEPAGAASMAASVRAGRLTALSEIRTIAGTLAPRQVGPNTLAMARALVDELVTVTDAEMIAAMKLLWASWSLLVEPAGAAALAAVLHGRIAGLADRRVGVLLCGANFDIENVWPQAASP